MPTYKQVNGLTMGCLGLENLGLFPGIIPGSCIAPNRGSAILNGPGKPCPPGRTTGRIRGLIAMPSKRGGLFPGGNLGLGPR